MRTLVLIILLSGPFLKAQESPFTIGSIGLHAIVPADFSKLHGGANVSEYLRIGNDDFLGASVLVHYVPNRINTHVGLGFMHFFEKDGDRTWYWKGEAGLGISTHVNDVGGQRVTDQFYETDTLSAYGGSAQAAFGMRNDLLDVAFFTLYQDFPGNKFWFGMRTGFSL